MGGVDPTKEYGLMVAHKKMKLRNVSIMDISAVAASGTNYQEAQLMKNGTLIGAVVDTQLGLLAREPLDLNLGTDAELTLEAGDVLTLQMTKNGSGVLTEASAHVDSLMLGC